MLQVIEVESGKWVVVGDGIYQEYDPDMPGYVVMTKSRAEDVAAVLEARIVSE